MLWKNYLEFCFDVDEWEQSVGSSVLEDCFLSAIRCVGHMLAPLPVDPHFDHFAHKDLGL